MADHKSQIVVHDHCCLLSSERQAKRVAFTAPQPRIKVKRPIEWRHWSGKNIDASGGDQALNFDSISIVQIGGRLRFNCRDDLDRSICAHMLDQ